MTINAQRAVARRAVDPERSRKSNEFYAGSGAALAGDRQACRAVSRPAINSAIAGFGVAYRRGTAGFFGRYWLPDGLGSSAVSAGYRLRHHAVVGLS